ncbi:MAG: hypothetical protein MI757_21670 [Pirellulales bacterium]|nr:hypothetical protein [Pirellulales bacterium]
MVGKLTLKGDREGLQPFPAGPIRQTLRIKTNVREVDTIPISLGGSVVREIDISARGWNSIKRQLDLHLLNDKAKEKLPLHVWVRGNEWENVDVELESVSPDWLKVSKSNTESRAKSKTKHIVFNIHVDKDAEAKYLEDAGASRVGKIVLKTTHSEMKTIDIPVQLAPEPKPDATMDQSPPANETAPPENEPETADEKK